jgi:hypothetical protein
MTATEKELTQLLRRIYEAKTIGDARRLVVESLGDAILAAPTAPTGAQPVADRSAEAKYQELLYAVASKHPGETRHQTALRYIRQAEAPTGEKQAAAMGTPQQAEPVALSTLTTGTVEQERPMTFEDRLRDLEEEDQMFEDRDMGDS